MNKISLDLSRLLGFRIISSAAAGTLHSPKIGGKVCVVQEGLATVVPRSPMVAKIGNEPG